MLLQFTIPCTMTQCVALNFLFFHTLAEFLDQFSSIPVHAFSSKNTSIQQQSSISPIPHNQSKVYLVSIHTKTRQNCKSYKYTPRNANHINIHLTSESIDFCFQSPYFSTLSNTSNSFQFCPIADRHPPIQSLDINLAMVLVVIIELTISFFFVYMAMIEALYIIKKDYSKTFLYSIKKLSFKYY